LILLIKVFTPKEAQKMRTRWLPLIAVIIVTILSLSIAAVTYAEDLPIDITTIGRQGDITSPITTRFGAHLFTADAQRINELLAQQVRHRQETANELFLTVSADYTVNPNTQIINTTSQLALFSQPMDFNSFSSPQEADSLSTWIIVLIFATCAIAGFIWALISKARKARNANAN